MNAIHSPRQPRRVPPVEIVPLDPDRDLPEVLTIADVSFSNPWTRDVFIQALGRPNKTRALVARSGSCAVGYCVGEIVLDELHVHSIAVSPTFRGRGVGRTLLTTLVRQARAWGVTCSILEVRSSNVTARELYKRLGFSLVGRRPAYYRDPVEDAAVYSVHST